MRECLWRRDIPALICCVRRIGEDHDVAVGICKSCQLRAFESSLCCAMAPVRIDKDRRIGRDFLGKIEVERDIGWVGAEGLSDLDERIRRAGD